MKAVIELEGKTYLEFPQFIQNDYGFDIDFEIKTNNNVAVNLSTYDVYFKAIKQGETTTKIDGLCTITNTTSGLCTYTILETDLDEAGKYLAYVECSSPTEVFNIGLGNLIIASDLTDISPYSDTTYIGNPTIDGSFRLHVVDGILYVDKRVSGAWVESGRYF